jgi:hypothetical protein
MRNLLQNKTVVSCLAVVAVVCLAGNFIDLPRRQTANADARENAVPAEEAREDSYRVPPLSSVAAELRNWWEVFPVETPRRDPFAAVFVPPPSAVTNTATMPSFQLQAVSLAAGRALAVINRRVVAEGEFIENCRVEKILPREVRLVSPVFGHLTATFDRAPARSRADSSNKAASANRSSADLPAGPTNTTGSGGVSGVAR